MSICCGIVGLPSCGKTTIFNAITASNAGQFEAAEANRAIVNVPDERIQPLVDMYSAPKEVPATFEVVDIPGIKSGSTVDGGRGNKLLGHIKDVDAILHVVRCFDDENIPYEYDTADPDRDVETLEIEMLAVDAQTLQNKIERLTKKVRTKDKDALRESADCEKVKAAIEEGTPARKQGLSDQELASIRECTLLSVKPVLYVANIKSAKDTETPLVKKLEVLAKTEGAELVTVCGRDEAEISQLDAADQEEFLAELGLEESSMQRLIRASYRTLGLVNFITAGDTEVHIWTCNKGDKAPVAAGKIHSDMEKGFIRMEVIAYTDLMELGSEAAVAKAGKARVEGKDYEVKDGDIVVIRFNK